MYLVLIPLLPFLAFLVVGIFGHWLKDRAHLVAVPAVLTSCLLSFLVFGEVAGGRNIEIPLYNWMSSGSLTVELGLYFDRLTVAMLLPLVGSLLGEDPTSPEALEVEQEHILDLFRHALELRPEPGSA